MNIKEQMAEVATLRAGMKHVSFGIDVADDMARTVTAYQEHYLEEYATDHPDAILDNLPFTYWTDMLINDLSERCHLPVSDVFLVSWMEFQLNAANPEEGRSYYAPISVIPGKEFAHVVVRHPTCSASILQYYRNVVRRYPVRSGEAAPMFPIGYEVPDVVNMTEHLVVVVDHDKDIKLVIQPSGHVLRVPAVRYPGIGSDPVPASTIRVIDQTCVTGADTAYIVVFEQPERARVDDMPPVMKGRIYIVSLAVRMACPERKDFYSPGDPCYVCLPNSVVPSRACEGLSRNA